MRNTRGHRVLVPVLAAVALLSLISSIAVLHGQASADAAFPAYYQQVHDSIGRQLHAGRQASAQGAAATTKSADPDVGDNPLLTPDQVALAERAAPGHVVSPAALIQGQQQAESMANAGDFLSWQELGPRTLTNGSIFPEPVSGRLLAVAVSPRDSRIIYVGSAQGGIWKTTDGGRNWRPLTDFLPSLAVNTIAIDSKNPNIIFAGTGENNLSCDSYTGQGILRSTDGGENWTMLGRSLFAGSGIGNIILDPRFEGDAAHEHLIVGAGFAGRSNSSTESCDGSLPAGETPPNGVFLSSDGGQTFTETLNVGPLGPSDMVMSPANPDVLYAAVQLLGIFKSADGGHTWVDLNANPASGLPAPASGFDRVQIAISATDPSVLYSVYSNVILLGTHMQAFRTADGGATWTNLTSVPDVCDGQCWYDMPIAISPTDPNTVFIGGNFDYAYALTLLGQPFGPADCHTAASVTNLPTDCTAAIAKSSDGGKTWQAVDMGDLNAQGFPKGQFTLHPDDHAIVFDPSHPNVMYTGTDGGLFVTTNGGHSWNDLNPGLGTLQFQGVSVSPNGQIFGGTQDNGTEMFTPKTGLTWNSVDGGDGGLTQVDPSNPNVIYHTQAFVSLNRSEDDGKTFQEIDFPLLNDNSSFYPAFSLAPSQPSTLYYGTYRIWRTDDKGGTGSSADWTPISGALEPANCNFNCIVGVAVSPVNPNVVVIAGGDGRIWQSTNADSASPTWTEIDTKVNPNRFPTQVVFAPGSQDTIYVTYSGFNSTPGSSAVGHLFRGTGIGGAAPVFTEIDGQNGGNPFFALPDLPTNSVLVDPQDPSVLFAAADFGVYVSPDSGAHWFNVSSHLAHAEVYLLAFNPTNNSIVAATHGRGMWQLRLPGDDNLHLNA